MNKTQIKAMLASYARSVLGAVIALYLSGVTDPGKLAVALLAALAPVALRALNPKDKAFGVLPTEKEVDDALANAKNADTTDIVNGIAELEKLIKAAKPVAKKTPPKK